MVKDKILEVIDSKICAKIGKVDFSLTIIHQPLNYCEYVCFPNGDYLFDRYKDFIATLTDDAFIPQIKRRYDEYENGIDECQLMKYIGCNLRVEVVDSDTLSISYDYTETFDDIVMRIYMNVLEYAWNCLQKEYLGEHTEVKMHDVKDFYGKWIEDYKPSQFKGIEPGDFIAVKVKYTDDEGGFDIKVGWYDKNINDNGYNIFVSNVDGEYEITSWCPMPKVKD